ncbi:MAG: hypothetical protein M1832_004864 [Thelocarpon impressellum]|nr:MAG: hypothetical protein M1832_004864 [Thelocarpon impressellum]
MSLSSGTNMEHLEAGRTWSRPASWSSNHTPQASPASPRDPRPVPEARSRPEKASSRVAHTLTACGRCRNRKTKCDPGLPKCGPCDKSGAACEYWDQAKGKMVSRGYVIRLQEKVRALEAELARCDVEEPSGPDAEDIARGPGLVRFDEGIEPRFLGSSSGIAMTRLVMELAKETNGTTSIRELVPKDFTSRSQEQTPLEQSGETKAYPMLSSVAASALPTRPTTDKLAEVFCQRSQFLLPTLHEPTFRDDIEAVYNGSTDAYKNFVLRMVLAISLQKIGPQFAGLADSYYLAAFSYVVPAMRPMDLKTLQCLVLIGQYSLLTPTRTAVYYVIGLATRLCQQLGLHEEETILRAGTEFELDPLEKDMRRRLFWIVTSMEYGLSHSLGRPSALSIGPDHIDVRFFAPVDDELVAASGILDGPPSPKKLIAIHFFQMRLLQAEIRRKLYQKKRDTPKDDSDPWFPTMEAKVEHWRSSSPYNAEGSGHSNAWFTSKYNTIIVLLYRPSPQIPTPSPRAALVCFEASAYNIRMQRKQIHDKTVDITWILVQSIFMALNTILWSIQYLEVRQVRPKAEFEELMDLGLESIRLCSDRWPGAASAYERYTDLTRARVRIYEGASDGKTVMNSPSTHASPDSHLTAMGSPSPQPSPGPHMTGSARSTQSSPSFPAAPPQVATMGRLEKHSPASYIYDQQSPPPLSSATFGSTPSPGRLNSFPEATFSAGAGYDVYKPELADSLPWDPLYTSPPLGHLPFESSSAGLDTSFFPAMSPDQQYGQLLYPQPTIQFQPQEDTLSHSQQLELMDTLETDGVVTISSLLDQSKNFFNSLGTP